MKKSNIRATVNNKIITTIAMINIFFIIYPMYVQAQNLNKAKDALNKFKTELDVIIPIAAAVILLCLAIGYAGRYIEKDTFVRWAIGVVIAGSVTEIVSMLFIKP
ncbi:ribose/xylose/arabinose/galactoside ABC-type transport system permease subunit [Bartonella callosciuri]|uniref:Ribose/xylose/arabinose/galactoside ABC-type transport system permease subunit n=1 Tax=Bartonella callosciuri TaxID=686223 RepID=A0A840NNE6_9HYPH|nr:VirB2 family type IV secretion system major pilin TrwL [Bartonella callosciuri]MBB5074246.1 ribose/xylose/arabinose/galactoside ABC-type transport system permease subunit [Bartonella callosciuri]